jgi:hypothetical protein
MYFNVIHETMLIRKTTVITASDNQLRETARLTTVCRRCANVACS